MLDDLNVLKQRDPKNALGVAAAEWQQAQYAADIQNSDHDGRPVTRVVVAGMGGSVIAALFAKAGLYSILTVTFEIVREYELPEYIDASTLVIVSSCSGNTEETLSSLEQAAEKGAQLAILTSGGKLLEQAKARDIAYMMLPDRTEYEPRMTTIAQLRALMKLLAHFGVVSEGYYEQVSAVSEWLKTESAQWLPDVPTDKNYAKQLALLAVGKTAVFYGGRLTGPVAYKWKISWNENAKNVSFWNVYPETSHNEFIGWSSHPVDKPFAVFDLKSSFDHSRILKRFEVTDRLLSGKRPKAVPIELQGDSPLAQQMWGCILADFVSIYLAILNGVDPTPVDLVEKFKAAMVKD